MSDRVDINGPVGIESHSAEAAALNLAKLIASYEESGLKSADMNREYWLTLYHQCRRATSVHASLNSILLKPKES
jgi:hypothetical protein